MTIETIIDGGWLKARPAMPEGAEPVPWLIVTSDEGISQVRIERRSASLVYVSYVRNGERRKRMLSYAGRSISVGPEIRAERRRQ